MSNQNQVAATPPMGWNSFDDFGCAITEAEAREQAEAMAKHLLPFGYNYFVIDAGWYGGQMASAGGGMVPETIDEYGRYWPSPTFFPSAAGGAGFKPFADFVHGLGLKFGLHIMRGIPRTAVERNTAILGSTQKAATIADTRSTCPWSAQMYGLDMNHSGSHAYYLSIVQLFAQWDLDFIKMDDTIGVSPAGRISVPYYSDEVEAVANAIKILKRPIVLSLSPGNCAEPSFAGHMKLNSQMARISQDVWDKWEDIKRQLCLLNNWTSHRGNGFWPDADMLPLGLVGKNHMHENSKSMGPERVTKLTPVEQKTMMTLWCMARSPLIFGGNMAKLDPATLALLTNREVLEANQTGSDTHQLFAIADTHAWVSNVAGCRDKYLALFNASDSAAAEIQVPLSQLGAGGKCYVRDLWAGKDVGSFDEVFKATVPVHGSALYRVRM